MKTEFKARPVYLQKEDRNQSTFHYVLHCIVRVSDIGEEAFWEIHL